MPPVSGEDGVGDGSPAGDVSARSRRSSVASAAAGTFVPNVGQEEFVEGLIRAGYVNAREDAPALFDFLHEKKTGCIGPQEFDRLGELGAPPASSAQLLQLHDFLAEKIGDTSSFAEAAFSQLQAAGGEGDTTLDCMDLETLRKGLANLEFPAAGEGGVEAEAIFTALDPGAGGVTCESLRTLTLHRRLTQLYAIEKVAQWLIGCCGSLQGLIQQVDDTKSGTITADSWRAAMERLGYPDLDEADLAFQFVALEKRHDGVDSAALSALEHIDAAALPQALPKFRQLIEGGSGEIEAAFARLRGADHVGSEPLIFKDFEVGCQRLGYRIRPEPRTLFALLASDAWDVVGQAELRVMATHLSAVSRGRLANCKAFILDAFGNAGSAFRKLFDDCTEQYQIAETTQPCLKWPQPSVSGYRGREWLQRLLNTLGDERGRNCTDEGEVQTGGAWLYFFPVLAGGNSVTDFKKLPPASQKDAKLARWHHGQAFADLRRLGAPAQHEGTGTRIPFRIFLSQLELQPADVREGIELPKAPFGESRTYLTGFITLEQPLVRLCPRDIPPLPQACGEDGVAQPLIPPPPEKKPPPSSSEELEFEARRIVGRLANEFARMCHERGLEEDQIIGHGGAVGPYKLLGHEVERGFFMQWLRGQDAGGIYRELAADLRPAVVRHVRAQVPRLPACGLNGSEKDAMYSGIRDVLLAHLFRALNKDASADYRRRDARLWKSPGDTPVGAVGSSIGAARAAAGPQNCESVDSLKRLAFEYEVCGDYDRAKKLLEERLALPQAAENSESWYDFARFLMRCGQKQLEAEKALRFAMSVRPPSEGPALQEVAFLAFLMLNTELPCSVLADNEAASARLRFEAASALLEGHVDKHPTERMAYFFLFVVYAVEARRQRDQATRIVFDEDTAAEIAARVNLMSAKATKYLEMARKPLSTFGGTLGGPPGASMSGSSFSDLETLLWSERLNRGEVVNPPPKPEVPEAWSPEEMGVFESYKDIHKVPTEDDTAALSCIDALLHFGIPTFVDFLVTEASEVHGFLSTATAVSERCALQRVRAAMLRGDWVVAEALIQEMFEHSDRIREAYALLGECRYRAARDSGSDSAAAYAPALAAFQTSLDFTEPTPAFAGGREDGKLDDPVTHLRLASIYFMRAEESGFTDEASTATAMEHLKQSLLIAPTAEAWRCAGVCSYQEACLRRRRLRGSRGGGDAAAGGDAASAVSLSAALAPEVLFAEALRFLSEANVLDRRRPQINAWLAICCVEMGRVQIAKQTIRQVLRFADRLDARTALQLATMLLRFSDESRALPGERPHLVREGRYAGEVVAVAPIAFDSASSAEAHRIMARAHAMLGEDENAVNELLVALHLLDTDPKQQDEIIVEARACAARMLAMPKLAAIVEMEANALIETRPSESSRRVEQ
eukprot:TRINITY_DN30343_c0_g1_i1.p1 TRINITY_DN30343_c0_g1~~TRINITY_DN30343_c0_g1_i1.p1  ORF type:complete len:1568 (-),score=298.28 TRINITY_DN30343_c0_g1_i1:61-4311(-)